MLLKDKVVIISGIGPGLGVKLAVEAARYGATAIAIGARTAEKLDDAERRIKEVNSGCAVLKQVTDIRDEAQCKQLAESTRDRMLLPIDDPYTVYEQLLRFWGVERPPRRGLRKLLSLLVRALPAEPIVVPRRATRAAADTRARLAV